MKQHERQLKKDGERTMDADARALILAAEMGAEIPEVDLHGMDRLDAKRHIEQAVDAVFVAGDRVVRIVHGAGQGILRKLAREILEQNELVDGWHSASAPQSAGVTYAVILKRN
ncbi:hypothetical protein A3I45_00125 [Candidatus Uhrbacteria bacterium RIFCSPLOWO2_02_FULL_53_10]|uniref:Smr domain-containing protein n=1 Tax=Candidatus Uhrbacteria bacterium RIFCSPLOWO2_02_FULL_53_10 TaxID=1802411 RepID=A0A1F7VGG0_9BACT|nr:MAG: hypothetical protein A3I45_00125 [Candidatus Uhrbacteria bacterium RIFCSPLOWO2_02_FULL_53_10]